MTSVGIFDSGVGGLSVFEEIRKLAIATLRVLQEEAPALFGDFEIQPLDDGTEMAHPEHSKV